MISRIVLLEPGVFDKRNVHPLKWWGEVYIADRLRMIKNCSIVIDVILLNIVAFFRKVSLIEDQLTTFTSLVHQILFLSSGVLLLLQYKNTIITDQFNGARLLY